jgi:hypothetical protein
VRAVTVCWVHKLAHRVRPPRSVLSVVCATSLYLAVLTSLL